MSNEKELTLKQKEEIEKIKRFPKQPVTQAAYARYIGASRQYVNQLVRDGIVILKNGKVIPHDADIAIEESVSNLGEDGEDTETLQQHKIEKAKHDARLAKLKADEAEGKVVSRDDVVNYYYETCREVTKRLEAMPKNLAVPLNLTHAQQQIIKKEIHHILDHLTATLIHKD